LIINSGALLLSGPEQINSGLLEIKPEAVLQLSSPTGAGARLILREGSRLSGGGTLQSL
jgi:hypothetical protein